MNKEVSGWERLAWFFLIHAHMFNCWLTNEIFFKYHEPLRQFRESIWAQTFSSSKEMKWKMSEPDEKWVRKKIWLINENFEKYRSYKQLERFCEVDRRAQGVNKIPHNTIGMTKLQPNEVWLINYPLIISFC